MPVIFRRIYRTNSCGLSARYNYAVATPADIDIAIPATRQTVGTIMSNYPLTWQRASNANYFKCSWDPDRTTCGLLYHKSYQSEPFTVNPRNWGLVFKRSDGGFEVVQDAPSGMDNVTPLTLANYDWGIGAGPFLVFNGQRTAIDRDTLISKEFDSLSETSCVFRVGIGYKDGDGLLIHLVIGLGGAYLHDVQDVAINDFGLTGPGDWFLNLDGGSSTTLLHKNDDGTVSTLIRNQVTVPDAFVLRTTRAIPANYPV